MNTALALSPDAFVPEEDSSRPDAIHPRPQRHLRLIASHGRLLPDDQNNPTTFTYVAYTYGAPTLAGDANGNRAGRITQVVSHTTTTSQGDKQDTEERHYGKLGEVVYEKKTVVTYTDPLHPSVFETQYQYDTFGRLQTLTYPDGEVLTNQYDAGGNLKSAASIKNGFRYNYLRSLTYDKFEQRVQMVQGNGITTTYTYDAKTRRLNHLTAGRSGGTQFQALTYAYDKVGNILSLSNQVPVPAANTYGGPVTQAFTYDSLYRLTQAQGSFQNAPNKTHTYTLAMGYDTIHNIVSKTQAHTIVQPSGTPIPQKKTTYDWTYAYNASGPTSTRPHAPTHIGERSYTYDLNGNQTGWTHDQNGTRRDIVWDEENRIKSLFDNGHEKAYKYDDQGNRTIKRGPQGETVYVNQFYTQRPGATGTKHVYAGTSRIASKLMRQDVPGANPAGKTPYEKDLYFYHPDHLGSSSYVTDLNGKLYEHLQYFPFGEAWIEENTNAQRTPYHFTAKELDEETGLYYFGARYYGPRTAVWQSADPILQKYLPLTSRSNTDLPGEGGVYASLNLSLYAYAGMNPVIYRDPDGNVRLKDAGAALLGIASNGAGIFVGGTLVTGGAALLVAPEPVLTKLAGAGSVALGSVVFTKSTAGVALNAANLRAAIEDRDPYVESSLARVVANEIAPGNKTAKGIADIADLSLDLAAGKAPVGLHVDKLGGTALPGASLVNINRAKDLAAHEQRAGSLLIPTGVTGTSNASKALNTLQGGATAQTAADYKGDYSNMQDYVAP